MNSPFDRDWTKVDVDVKVSVNSPSPSNPPAPQANAYADITVLMDRSSSMMPMRQAVVDSFNQQIKEMRETPGDNRWTFVQFDDPDSARGAGEAFPKTVFEHKSEREIRPLTVKDYEPRGVTALVDAVCLTMRQISARTSGQEERIKPILMIVTDGQENASKEFTSAKMREMIARRQNLGWEFTFLAANQDAWAEAGKYGMAGLTRGHVYDYAGSSILSGAICSGQTASFSFSADATGVASCIASGLANVRHMASGSAYNHARTGSVNVAPNVTVNVGGKP